MPHPHQYLLKEYQIAINKLVPTVPKEVKENAQRQHDEFLGNENATEDTIRAAMAETGRAEYAYRHAYEEITKTAGDARYRELVLEHLEESVRAKVEPLLASGATLEDIVKSQLFEDQFSAEERYQVQDGILDAKEHLREEMAEFAVKNEAEYQVLVEKWQGEMERISQALERLRELSGRDPKWKDEILGRVRTFEEGWSVTEPDPRLEEIEKEIEYWRGTFGEEV